MEDNFRNTLIIISAIVIAAIFVHGYWTIRKQKNPYKLKTEKERIEPESRGFDGSGFDQDGVSKPKVVSNNSRQDEPVFSSAPAENNQAFTSNESLVQVTMSANKPPHNDNVVELMQETESLQRHQQEFRSTPSVDAPHVDHDLFPEQNIRVQEQPQQPIEAVVAEPAPVYQQPVTQAKPNFAKSIERKVNARKKTSAAIKRNQMEINFGDGQAASEEMHNNISAGDTLEPNIAPPSPQEPQVLVLSVVMPQEQQISGAALLPTLLTLGMKYGEMNIFHRHQDNAGNGKVTFSLANMMNPGTFDLDAMENFTTQGITLFMTLPNAGDPFEVFQQMLNAAKQLAVEFQGQLLDDKRSVMTKQTEQHYTGLIREFERKNRIGVC